MTWPLTRVLSLPKIDAKRNRKMMGMATGQLTLADAAGQAEPYVSDDPLARHQLVGSALGHDPPVFDDGDAVSQVLRLVHVVRGEEHRLAEVAQAGDEAPRPAPGSGVE